VPTLRSLTQDEARERGAMLTVNSYDIAVDMTGMADGNELRAVSTIRFRSEPGAASFADCAAEVVSATLNGESISADAVGDSRIALADLREDNELVVESVQASTDQATAVHRSVDAADGKVYVWTSFEPDEARRAWACFDQPDLKAPHAFTVTAPADWTVVSNSDDPTVEDLGASRRWTFPATPPLSTYVPVVNAGPFYELRSEQGGYAMGLYCRQSLSSFLDRDAEQLFDLTARGLAFFGEKFDLPFPQRTYDQVFVPDLGGAMENFGCVTWGDGLIFRTPPSPSERELVAYVLLHEMAHMWFGDMVTMAWWDDLWLNEAFASWASYWAASEATEFTDAWAGFLAEGKLGAYPVDCGPTTHPIRQPAHDVAEATAGFDSITYQKGAAVLKQLVAYVGEDSFVAGLRAYFRAHAWHNASLEDLMGELATASGRDLATWTKGWLDTAGTDTLRVVEGQTSKWALSASGPSGEPPRPHRVHVGVYAEQDGTLGRTDVIALDVDSATTKLPSTVDSAELLLVNDDDLTFASVQLDEQNVARLLDLAAQLPAATSRAVALVTMWDMVVSGELPARKFVRSANAVLDKETTDSLVEPFLDLVLAGAERWSPDGEREELLSSVADLCLRMAQEKSRKVVALRVLARSAVTDQQLRSLRELTADDVDLSWRALIRFAALGQYDEQEVEALSSRDPDPDSWVRALAVETARPTVEAKQAAWQAVVDHRKVPISSLTEMATAFWQPSQADLISPFTERYLAAVPGFGDVGMLVSMSIASSMFPYFGVGQEFLDRVNTVATSPDVSHVVRQRVLERADQLSRMLRARGQAG
jgi:aminopeptidase N